jgi:hypothetical protein
MERELWMALYRLAMALGSRFGSWKFSAADIVVVYFWAVVHDRPMTWALGQENWPADLRPRCLPSQSTFSKRMRRPETQELMLKIEHTLLAALGVGRMLLCVIDGKPLTVSGVSKDPDARFGRGAGHKAKGYKLHAVWANGPLPLAWAITGMNASEKTVARDLLSTLPGGGYVLGDGEFDSNPLYDAAHESGYQLVVRKRRGKKLGHRRQSPHRLRSIDLLNSEFGRSLYDQRGEIERSFGAMVSFGGGLICLPPWARRITRVRNWVHTKLLINALRWCRQQKRPLPALE